MYGDLCRIEVPVIVIIPAAVFRVCNKDPGSWVEGGTCELEASLYERINKFVKSSIKIN